MQCPECNGKITAKDYDTGYSWYECPGCEGCFTGDEIMEAEIGTGIASPRAKSGTSKSGTDGVVTDVRRAEKKVVAKGKKRRSEIAEDDEAIAEFEKEQAVVRPSSEKGTKHRDEVPVIQVVNIMADELQEIYSELGGTLNEVNAQDKALTIWREVHIKEGISAREKEVPMKLCKVHNA